MINPDESMKAFGTPKHSNEFVYALVFRFPIKPPHKPRIEGVATGTIRNVRDPR
jgi:hypothetical protein